MGCFWHFLITTTHPQHSPPHLPPQTCAPCHLPCFLLPFPLHMPPHCCMHGTAQPPPCLCHPALCWDLKLPFTPPPHPTCLPATLVCEEEHLWLGRQNGVVGDFKTKRTGITSLTLNRLLHPYLHWALWHFASPSPSSSSSSHPTPSLPLPTSHHLVTWSGD